MAVKNKIIQKDGKDFTFENGLIVIRTGEQKVRTIPGSDPPQQETYYLNESIAFAQPQAVVKKMLTKITKADIATFVKVIDAINESNHDIAAETPKPSLDSSVASGL